MTERCTHCGSADTRSTSSSVASTAIGVGAVGGITAAVSKSFAKGIPRGGIVQFAAGVLVSSLFSGLAGSLLGAQVGNEIERNLPAGNCQCVNEQIAQSASRQLVNFALEQNVNVIVLENLKGWRPKAGARRSSLRQRFHGWLHRRLAHLVEEKFQEVGGRVVYVYARGTSSWAFDGSGAVKRNTEQYELATFSTGKQYNCDLNASYNIGARYWAMKLQLAHRKDEQLPEDRSSPDKPRIPVTLSTLLHHVRAA